MRGFRVGDWVRVVMPGSFRYGKEFEVLEVEEGYFDEVVKLTTDSWYSAKFLENVGGDPVRKVVNKRLAAYYAGERKCP